VALGPVARVTARPIDDLDRVVGVVLFVVAGLLLTSMGGGIVAAPVTLPLLLLVVRRHPSRTFRIAAAVIGGLTAAELTWGLFYLLAGEAPVAIWLLPTASGLATAFGFLSLAERRRLRGSNVSEPRPPDK